MTAPVDLNAYRAERDEDEPERQPKTLEDYRQGLGGGVIAEITECLTRVEVRQDRLDRRLRAIERRIK